MTERRHGLGQIQSLCFMLYGLNTLLTVVQCAYMKAAVCKEEGVSSLASSEFEDMRNPCLLEDFYRFTGRFTGLITKHLRVSDKRPLLVVLLRV